ncbi:hypothetical protein ABGV42_00870 [Paenibacillus pabuli]|uniref:hypothetical protein n=1 Tax=Paenibacillus pabuli TaxID=1472 RepID=UPI003242FE63
MTNFKLVNTPGTIGHIQDSEIKPFPEVSRSLNESFRNSEQIILKLMRERGDRSIEPINSRRA